MRSRSNSLEEEGSPDPLPPRGRGQEERETPPGRAGGRSRYREGATPVAAQRNRRKAESARGGGASGDRKEKGRDLSRDDLLFLLSMLEGELQARDEVITVLRAENVDLALLEAKYGFVVPHQVLRALQRDTPPGRDRLFQEDIYEKPMAELERLVETQRRAGARTLEQLLRAERSLRHALAKMADGERNHQDFMRKSDDFTNLLEQERERLKLLLDQEKAYQERKEEESNKKVLDLKDELTKLKSFALMVVDEQQRLTEQLGQQTARVQELTAAATNAQEELGAADARLQEEEGKVSGLESQLREHACRRQQEQEAMTAKLAGEDAQNRVLRQKLSTLGRQRDELEETNKTLRRAEEELQELRDKIGRGDCGNSSLMSEVEELRKRVLEMEGKDEELIRMEEQCRDLNRKLVKEAGQSQGLKVEVDKLNQRIMELEKLEEAFGKSKQECSALKGNLEKEKLVSKVVASDLDALRAKVKELETAESQLGKTEASLKEDLTKLKTLTVMLMDERKTTAERMRQMESKVQNSSGKLQAEQDMVNSVTERLIGESKRALRSKAELEQKMCSATKERDELKAKLRAEVEKSRDLDSKVGMMKKRLQSLEHVESEYIRSGSREEREHATTPAVAKRFQQEDNKVRELTQEVERLRNKLKDGKAVEGEPPKNDELELLEKSFAMEREKARTLTEELDILRTELSKYQLAEKNDCHQQHVLYKRLKEEEAKSSHLTLEVSALKEKIHEFMGTEESICRMKNDHTSQQRRLTQQEVRNKELAREMDTLTRELDRYRRFSKSLRPGMSGRRFSDLLVSTKEVQTEPADLPRSSGAAAEPLERAVLNGRLEHSGEDEGSSGGAVRPAAPSPSLWNHNAASLRPPGRGSPPGGDGGRGQGPPGRQGEALLNHSPGRPLHIRVTPDLGVNAALLEMASPERHAPSYTSTALIPTGGGPAKQRITIIQNASPSPAGAAPQPGALSPVQVVSAPRGGPGAAGLRGAPERRGGWPVQRSDSGGPPAVFTTDDNKIHIHLGAPFLQSISGGGGHALLQTAGPARASAAPDQRPVAKGNGKVTSSITIKPTSGPMQRPAHITVPAEASRRPGPTRIPKPRRYGSPKGTQGPRPQTPRSLRPRGRAAAAASHHNNNNPNLANRKL